MSPQTAIELKQLGIGEKIRSLRTAKKMGLDALAKKLGVSKILLGQIEEDVIPPTVATLLNISKILGVGIDHFFSDVEQTGKFELTRADERLSVHHDDLPEPGKISYNYESLAYRLAKKHMEPFFVQFDVSPEEGESYSHDGEEFIHVIKGEIEVVLSGDRVRLNAGDSLYFYANVPHTIRGIGPEKPEAVIVLYPYSS